MALNPGVYDLVSNKKLYVKAHILANGRGLAITKYYSNGGIVDIDFDLEEMKALFLLLFKHYFGKWINASGKIQERP